VNALVVDDEPLARDWLIRLLARLNVEVCGEASDGRQALTQARSLAPDVVLLDIQIPGLSGLQVARALGEVPFVFTTAHARYAVEAFAVEACDYLLKPVGHAQLATSLERARRRRLLHELMRMDDAALDSAPCLAPSFSRIARGRDARPRGARPGGAGSGGARPGGALVRIVPGCSARRGNIDRPRARPHPHPRCAAGHPVPRSRQVHLVPARRRGVLRARRARQPRSPTVPLRLPPRPPRRSRPPHRHPRPGHRTFRRRRASSSPTASSSPSAAATRPPPAAPWASADTARCHNRIGRTIRHPLQRQYGVIGRAGGSHCVDFIAARLVETCAL